MNVIRLALVGLTLSALVTPCVGDDEAAEADEAKEAKEAKDERVCVNSRSIRSFDGLSDKYVFIEERSKTYFLMTMRSQCNGLRSANGIMIQDTTSKVCSDGFAEIRYRDRGMGMRRCRIGKIESVESKDAAKALVAERKDAKNVDKDQNDNNNDDK
jgi:hypothetical protein